MDEIQKINVNTDFIGPLIIVEDVFASRKFYEEIVGQVLKFDFGDCQQFESGLTLQSKDSVEMLGLKKNEIKQRSNNFTLYFETENFDSFVENLKRYELEYVHEVVEFKWGQRSASFYDLDEHIIDVSEKMQSVFNRLFESGLTAEEISKKTQHPIDYVRLYL